MRKRLRRKKHLGEFRQFGFSVSCRFREGLPPEEFDRFVDDFISDAIEVGRLEFGGAGSPERGWSGVVCRNHRHDSTTEEDRERVRAWLSKQTVVKSITVSEPWDVWHGPDPFEALQPNR